MTSSRKTILATANTSWYLYNFRLGLLRRLRECGWGVVLVAPSDDYSGRLAAEGFRFQPIAIDSSGTNPIRDLFTIRAYASLLNSLSATVVLSFTPKVVIYSGIAARHARIPTVATVTGLGSSFVRLGLVTRIVKRLYRTALDKAGHVFFQNPDDLEFFLSERLLQDHHSYGLVGGSGVDPERFSPRPRQDDGMFAFLLAARMLRDKGVGEYVEAARHIRKRFSNTRFLLLGKADVDNPSAIPRAQLEQWTRDGHVEYLGDTDDIRPHIAASDVVVLPSYREGLPRVLLEASSMMRPIVTTDTTGCREVVTDGVNGFLCKVRNAVDLAAVLEKMLSLPPAERHQMAVRGRQRIVERFSEQSVVGAYLQAIERVSAAHR